MTSWMPWTLTDDDGTNPLGETGAFDFDVEYEFDPGSPEWIASTHNEDYQNCPATVTLTHPRCTYVELATQPRRKPTVEEIEALAEWFWTVLDSNPQICDDMKAFGVEQMSFTPDVDDLYE